MLSKAILGGPLEKVPLFSEPLVQEFVHFMLQKAVQHIADLAVTRCVRNHLDFLEAFFLRRA